MPLEYWIGIGVYMMIGLAVSNDAYYREVLFAFWLWPFELIIRLITK